MNTQRYDDLPYVAATLNYLAPTAERPRNYTFDPPARHPPLEYRARPPHCGNP